MYNQFYLPPLRDRPAVLLPLEGLLELLRLLELPLLKVVRDRPEELLLEEKLELLYERLELD